MRRARSSYSKTRKFHGNQHTQRQKSPENCSDVGHDEKQKGKRLSASSRKLNPSKRQKINDDNTSMEKPSISGFRFVDMTILSSVFNILPCKECNECSLILSEKDSKRKGCASHLQLLCCSCGWKKEFFTSSKVSRYFEVNRRFVYALRSIGCGHAAAKRFCGLMNMPTPPRPTPYARHNKELLKAVKQVSMETMASAAKELHDLKPDFKDGLVKCGVSCDGTWQRRGFASLNGCVSAISIDMGKVLDVEVLSKVCKKCKLHEDDKNTPQNSAWKQDHQDTCKANYKGSAPAMEPEGASRIFKRSMDSHKLVYDEYFGDGDSKSFDCVKDTYKDHGITVQKKECVGHVQKRLGTALRKLKKENKGLGGKGKLTDRMIDKLQNYYGIAIRSNSGNLEGMKKAIHACLFHCASTEKRPLHSHCPEGPDSWCGYMADKANKTNNYKHGAGLPVEIAVQLKPTFNRLSDDVLLSRCLDGKTQNQNESLNGMIWERLPKQTFIGSDLLQLGVHDAVAHFNIGCEASIQVLKNSGINPGKYCQAECSRNDNLRVKKADYKEQDKVRLRRKVLRGRKKKRGDQDAEKEGETYACGSF